MNAAEYAKRIGVSRMRVIQYIQQGKITAKRNGRIYEIDANLADQQLKRSIDPRQSQAKSKPAKQSRNESIISKTTQSPSFADAQRALMIAKAERERLALLKEKGELVDSRDIKIEAFNLARTVREGLLNIPDRISGQLAGESDSATIHSILSQEIRQALIEMANEQ